jgi:DNA-binding transcriptional regulator YdaS (Cro superfamily)
MKLSAYLASAGLSESAFAAMLEVNPKAVRHWIRALRTPRPEQMQKIVAVTRGAVTPNDFLPSAPSVAAE